jgi:hypothetical protein
VSATDPPLPKGLRWVQLQTTPVSRELRDADDRVIGTLRDLPKPAVTWGFTDRRRARGEVGASHWDLSVERKGISGFFGLSATVLIDAGQTGVLLAGPFFTSGTLSLVSGRRLQWKGGVFEGPSAFLDERGRMLVQFRTGSYIKRVNAYVDVQPEAADMSEWPLLAVLGLYLRLLMNRVFDGS